MRAVGYIIGACLVLAVLRLALAVLLVVMLIGIVAGLFYRPAETFGLFVFLLIASLANEHGGALLLVVGLAVVSALVGSRKQ
jgi:hypothetical protein